MHLLSQGCSHNRHCSLGRVLQLQATGSFLSVKMHPELLSICCNCIQIVQARPIAPAAVHGAHMAIITAMHIYDGVLRCDVQGLV